MPRNGQGQYSLPSTVNPVISQTPITIAWGNGTMNDIASALTTSVASDGQTTMIGPLNMGNQRIFNVNSIAYAASNIGISGINQIGFSDGSTLSSGAISPGGAVVGTTAAQTLTNKTISGGIITGGTISGTVLSDAVESFTTPTATASALSIDVTAASLFYVSALSGATTVTLSNVSSILTMSNQSMTLAIVTTQTSSANYINAITVTGATTTTLRWFQNAIPLSGNPNGFDLYQISIFRTATNTYSVLASKAPF